MTIPHPSAIAQPEWVAAIRNTTSEAEKAGRLHAAQLKAIKQQGWFKMLVPQIYDGLELDLPNAVRLEECLSWIDGSVGWVVTLCSGAGWFGGFLNSEKAFEVFSNPDVCLAGSGAVMGTAELTNEGYLINGKWKYASGAYHATYFTANCFITQNGSPVYNPDGSQLIRPFIFNAADVQIIPTWNSMGLVATGSESFEVRNLQVTEHEAFSIDPTKAVVEAPLYLYPFLPLAEATTAINLSGMAWHFLDLCGKLFEQRKHSERLVAENKQELDEVLASAIARLDKARAEFYEILDASWAASKNNEAAEAQYKELGIKSRTLARIARECVDGIYPYCGLTAANITTEINQVWRDIHTASQHALLTFN